MSLVLFGVATLFTLFGGVYVGLTITERKFIGKEYLSQILAFSSIIAIFMYLKYLQGYMLVIDDMVVELMTGNWFASLIAFFINLSVISYVIFFGLGVIGRNLEILKRGKLYAKKEKQYKFR